MTKHMKAGPTKPQPRTGESAARALLLVLALGSSTASAAGDGDWGFGAKLSYDRAEGTYRHAGEIARRQHHAAVERRQ